jgi:hypothetical protein
VILGLGCGTLTWLGSVKRVEGSSVANVPTADAKMQKVFITGRRLAESGKHNGLKPVLKTFIMLCSDLLL